MPTQRGQSLKIEGLRDLQKALRTIDKSLAHELQQANKAVAGEVARDAQGKAHGISKGGERLARSIFAVAQQRSAAVQIRDAPGRTAGALGYEFGAGRDALRQRSSGAYVGFRQFDVWRGSGGSAGYAMYPAIRDAMPGLPERYADALDPLLHKAFPD